MSCLRDKPEDGTAMRGIAAVSGPNGANGAILDFYDAFPDVNSDGYPEGWQARSTRKWEVWMGPAKKRMVKGRPVVPSTRNLPVAKLLFRKRRRICLEIVERVSSEEEEEIASPATFSSSISSCVVSLKCRHQEVPSPHPVPVPRAQHGRRALGDDDHVFLQMYRPVRNGDPWQMEWEPCGKWKLDELRILSIRGCTLEVETGSARGAVSVSDCTFASAEEAKSYMRLVDLMVDLRKNRMDRQLLRYNSQTSFDGGIGDMQQHATRVTARSSSSVSDDETIRLLIEIVSATDLPDCSPTDPYVSVRIGGKGIHQTSVLPKTTNPIWTLRKGGLFVLTATPQEFFSAYGGMVFSVYDFNALVPDECLGKVFLPLTKLLEGTGMRIGYDIAHPSGEFSESSSGGIRGSCGRLYLRFREATDYDIEFLRDFELNSGKTGVYSKDSHFSLRPPDYSFLKLNRMVGKGGCKLYRVKPYPDPARKEETTWMTAEQIQEESMKPSTNFVEAGSGDLGKLYVEVIGASDLPNMDLGIIGDQTDAFACLVFEDSIVNTDVIGRCLSPRWMPWCRRSFVFNIQCFVSVLYVGVFDYDSESLAAMNPFTSVAHSPIGRVQVNHSHFKSGTVYTVAYSLYYGGETDNSERTQRGKIWLRLRKEWCMGVQKKALTLTASLPRPTVISVPRRVDFNVARYTTSGPQDDLGFSLTTFTRHIEEIQSYQVCLEYLSTLMYQTWLWHGHYRLKIFSRDVFLPLNSLVAFSWGVIVTRDFNTLPSFLAFLFGWALVNSNGYINRNPSPWKKRPLYADQLLFMINGRVWTETIAPEQNHQMSLEYEEEEEERKRQMKQDQEFRIRIKAEIRQELGVHSEEISTDFNSILDIATTTREGLLSKFLAPVKRVLFPIQQQMRQFIVGLRISRAVLLWEEAFFSFCITTLAFAVSIATFWIPFGLLLRWFLKLLVWVGLGPWTALAYRWYYNYDSEMTEQEKEEYIRKQMRKHYEGFLKQASNYQIRREEILKLRSLKNYMFGTFHVRVPRFSESLSEPPLPESFADPYNEGTADPVQMSERVFGQRLRGDTMIPQREVKSRGGPKSGRRQFRALGNAVVAVQRLRPGAGGRSGNDPPVGNLDDGKDSAGAELKKDL